MIQPVLRKTIKMNISSSKYEKIRDYSKSVLGKDYYVMIEDFFKQVWSSNAKYKVFLARRCLNLMYGFYTCRKIYDENERISIYSDSAFLANVPEIGDNFIYFGAIPKIMLIDDILIHGRAINTIIDSLITSLLEYCQMKGHSYSRDRIEQAVQNALSIKVLVQSKMILLNPAFAGCMDCNKSWEAPRWHELSSRISQLVAEGYYSNTSYILSLYEAGRGDSNIHSLFASAAEKSGFLKSEWNYRFHKDVWVRPLKNSSGDIVAFYTLRMIQNGIDNRYKITPFIITSDMHYENGSFPNGDQILLDDYKSEYSEINGITKNKVEAMYLALSHNILLLLQDKIEQDAPGSEKAKSLVSQSRLDTEKVSLNFKKERFSEEEDFFDRIINLKEPFASWDEMDRFILKSTSGSTPLLEHCTNDSFISKNKFLSDILAEEGMEIERQAYLQYTRQRTVKSTVEKTPLQILFSKLGKKYTNDSDIICIIGDMIRYMDMGALAIGVKCDFENESGFGCVYRAGEQSQFIYPKRYVKYMLVLIMMERDCNRNCEAIKNRIYQFFPSEHDGSVELADKLSEFVDLLYESGQYINDWDIDLLSWVETDKPIPNDVGFDAAKEILISRIFAISIEQVKSRNRYRMQYPVS